MTTPAIIKAENMTVIIQDAPKSYTDNRLSHDRCIQAGQQLLDAINEQGMNDEFDNQAAAFIEKARRTTKVMNERRSPITKLFDEVRGAFTALENEVDPAKAGTIPYMLQQCRNQYAAKKREEEAQRLQEEMARRQAEEARRKLRQDMEDDFKQQFRTLVDNSLKYLTDIDNSLTLQNYETSFATLESIQKACAELPEGWFDSLHTRLPIPAGTNMAEVEREIKGKLTAQFREQYATEVGDMACYIIDRLPSKKANLEQMAQANATEAARIKAEMEARQKAEAARMEQERAARQAEEQKKTEMERQAAEMTSLFGDQAATTAVSTSKAKVTKRINLLNPEGIMSIISLWWSKEGCTLSVDELAKMFKKQIAFCERLANKEDLLIENESVEYVDEVKAK